MQLLEAGADFAGGRYQIVRVLSAGGMGVVYEVVHRDTLRHRALKLMLPQLLLDDDMRARFTREGIVTAGIESEHLVEVFDVGIDAHTRAPFLVMELLRGEDLGARLQRRERTKPSDALEIVAQITRALDKTHAAGIVHRDLKPENLFVTHRDDGSLRMRILDFGIAKLVDLTGARAKDTRSVGTPLYMAPEQMTGQSSDIGPPADVYALAHIVFTLLVGMPYFQVEADSSDNVLGLMFKVSNGTVDPATKRSEAAGVELPQSFDAWFTRATCLQPSARFGSAGQLLKELRDVLKDAPEVLPTVASTRRKVAFSETVRLSDPPADASVSGKPVPVALTPVPPLQTRPTETGAVPSSRTLATPSAQQKKLTRAPIVLGATAVALVLGFGGYAALRDTGDKNGPSGVTTNVEAEPVVASSGISSDVPNITVGAAPESAKPSASGPISGTALSASASASVSAKPQTVKTAPRATTTPVGPTTAAPTVWGGPRR